MQHLERVESTNTWLGLRAREGAGEGTVVYCDFQSAGRGRLDRRWSAEEGSALLCSALLAPPAAALSWTIVAAALAIADALAQLTDVRPDLKWPNDVLYADLKVAGLLAEVIDADPTAVVVGLGLNLTGVDPALATATTVLEATGEHLAPPRVLRVYLDRLGERRALMETTEGLATLRRDYVEALSTLDRPVSVVLGGSSVHGHAVGIDDRGALLVRVGNEVRAFHAGDVVHLRGARDGREGA